jgi:hypothetical protein
MTVHEYLIRQFISFNQNLRGTSGVELQSSGLDVGPSLHRERDRGRQGRLPRRKELVDDNAVLLKTGISDLYAKVK